MNWKREINQLAGTDEEETPLLFRAFIFRKLHTQKHNNRVQKFPPLKIHRKQAFRNWQTPEKNLLLQPEQLQNAPKISCATSLREREGDLRMRSLFASNHQSSRTDATKFCPNIATDPRSLYPGPHPHLSLKLLFLLYEFHCSSGVRCVVSFGKHSSSCAPRRGKTRRYRYGDELEAASGAIFETSSECGCSAHNNPWGSVLFFSFCPQRLCQ